jgi:hypothetical protein
VLRRLDDYRAALAHMDNRAVFEVPGLIEQLLRSRVAQQRDGATIPARPRLEMVQEA